MSGLTWQSQNAPFSEDGQSMVLRDIETLFLALNQLQSDIGIPPSGESTANGLGAPADLPAGSTVDGRPIRVGQDPDPVTYPITVANGGTGGTTAPAARTNLGLKTLATLDGLNSTVKSAYTSGSGLYSVPAGVTSLWILMVGAAGGTGRRPAKWNSGRYSVTAAGAVSDELVQWYGAQSGGAGAVLFGCIPAVPGGTMAYSVGAAGTHGSSTGSTTPVPTNGGDTTITLPTGITITAGGGLAGTNWGGVGGGGGGRCSNDSPAYEMSTLLQLDGISAPSPGLGYSLGETLGLDTAAYGGVSYNGGWYGRAGVYSSSGGLVVIGSRAAGT
jgi:hypothetical protein